MRHLKNAFIIFPIMGYYFIESLIIAIFTSFVWNYVLFDLFKINISYFQWVMMIWIIKVVLFDIFKFAFNNHNIENTENNEI